MRAWKEEMERLLPWPLVGIRRARLQLAGEGERSSGMALPPGRLVVNREAPVLC